MNHPDEARRRKKGLSEEDQATMIREIIAGARRDEIVDAVCRLRVTDSGEWLPSDHPYRLDGLRKARRRVEPTEVPRFAELTAASAFTHCGDAWAYLGQAIDSLVRGDVEIAVHLAYYAELRAASSLLSAHGIVVGDRFQIALATESSVIHRATKLPTHQAMWCFLTEWGSTRQARDTIYRIVKPGAEDLHAWLAGSGAILTSAEAVRDLLEVLSLDLATVHRDRELRNTASYTPSRIVPAELGAQETQRVVTTLLSCLEPGANDSFPQIDAVIARAIIVGVYEGLTDAGEASSGTPPNQPTLADWFESYAPGTDAGLAVFDELIKEPGEGEYDDLLRFRDRASDSAPHTRVEGMLARALILSRFATGACSLLLRDSGCGEDHVRGWVNRLGAARGLWASGEQPEAGVDLWADIEVVRDVLLASEATDTWGLIDSAREQFPHVGQAERVLAWSF